ncbi:BEL1-like homeodomain protein [Seminavis robusta]|uniref:BEL1-like homeodomain protein n=1 Tax=Seminavis robusta TaxID=568900 RepID=A0A9N8DSA2_9STRA|nr:BEL1-like homeodomain protein [Seminavis robusta]|eukprot:Sro244_g097160.1 BEL1-like homeodomain protein (773) ;mRNA; r:32098-34612
MLQSVAPASYSLRTRLSRPELQAAKGRRGSTTEGAGSHENNNDKDNNLSSMADADGRNNQELGSDDEGDGGGKGGKSKSRRELPAGAVQTLKAWLLSPEHFTHPYPTPQDQAMLMQKTGIDKKQLKNWFTNARRRIWKPMLKKQIEQGKLTTTGVAGGVAVAGAVPGLMVPTMPGAVAPGGAAMDNPHSVQAMRAHYQQAVAQGQPQAPQQQVTVDAYGNQVYVQPQPPPLQAQQLQPPQAQPATGTEQAQVQQYYLPSAAEAAAAPGPSPTTSPLASMHQSNSIGSLPPMLSGSTGQLNKTDSHAVLMELFARDQDLVRQATESARMKAAAKKQDGQPMPLQPTLASAQQPQPAQSQQNQPSQQVSSQHPMKSNSQSRLASVPSLNSWPHFSSISSLNNLGNMPGVKSITSMSGVDLANQGQVNKMGNLAQVKSMESMGKNDSYAFLEVFFGDRSLNSMNNMAGKGGQAADSSKGRREREEDNDVGLSLDDEGPTTTTSSIKQEMGAPAPMSAAPQPAPLTGASAAKDSNDTGTLKRAYDDALAARGLMSVSRSSEKLTDLALPAKMQRSLSQEYIRQNQNPNPQTFGQFSYTPPPAPAPSTDQPPSSSGNAVNNSSQQQQPQPPQQQSQQQYAGQHPGEPVQQQQQSRQDPQQRHFHLGHPGAPGEKGANTSVQVPAATKCALCNQTNVDTQLRPCGHMFHEHCLKPTLQAHAGQPKCPVDHTAMQSALLAVPTDDPQQSSSAQPKPWSNPTTASSNQAVLSSENRGTSG